MKRTLTIEFPDELLAGAGFSSEEFMRDAKLLLAAKLYEMGRLTSGQAARFCEMDRVTFLFTLSQKGIAASNLTEGDAELEAQFAGQS